MDRFKPPVIQSPNLVLSHSMHKRLFTDEAFILLHVAFPLIEKGLYRRVSVRSSYVECRSRIPAFTYTEKHTVFVERGTGCWFK